jgi:hypothetical protein
VLLLQFMHAGQKILAVRRWVEPRVAGNLGVTQGAHVCPILVDPCVYLIGSAYGPVAGDEDIDLAGHALEQSQRGEVIPDRARRRVSSRTRKASDSESAISALRAGSSSALVTSGSGSHSPM